MSLLTITMKKQHHKLLSRHAEGHVKYTIYQPLFDLMKEVQQMIPGCEYYPRENFEIKDIVKSCSEKGYTDIVLFGQRMRQPSINYNQTP